MSCANCDCKYCEEDREDEVDPDEGINDPVLRAMWGLWRSCNVKDKAEVMVHIVARQIVVETAYLDDYVRWHNVSFD